MNHYCTKLLVGLVALVLVNPVLASIEGPYAGNFLTGTQGDGAYSYVHNATSAKKSGDAGYNQQAGGSIIFAMDSNDDISFTVDDVGLDGLGAGDKINLNFTVDLLKYDGSLNSTNDNLNVVATLNVAGSLIVGGTFSPTFTDGISNISAADQDPNFSGLDYTIEVVDNFSINAENFSIGDTFAGDAFFQSGNLAGPFNGVSYNNATQTISFAIWGDSRNMDANGDPHGTGKFTPTGGSETDRNIGFDIYIEAQFVPEASSVIVWSMLTFLGMSYFRRKNCH